MIGRTRVLISYDIPYPRFDGVSNLLRYLYPHFKRANIDVLLLFPQPKTQLILEHPPYHSIQVRGVAIPVYSDCTFGIPLIRAGAIIDEFKPDLVHAMAPFALGSSVIAGSRRRHIPSVGTFTTNIPEYAPYYGFGFLGALAWTVYKSIHNQCDINLAPSMVIKKEMELHGISSSAIWGRGVDSKRFSPDWRSKSVRSYLTNGHPNRKIVLYVGRLSPEKNLEALYKAVRDIKNVHTVIVGDGPLRNSLASLFSEEYSTFTGFLQGEELASAYASADLFVSPSLTEGFPNVVLEALASAVPAIGFDSNGVSELINDSGGGLVASSASHSDLRETICEYLETPSLFYSLGSAGRAYAVGRTWARCFDELLLYYNKLVT